MMVVMAMKKLQFSARILSRFLISVASILDSFILVFY